jgi:hypothetical protein
MLDLESSAPLSLWWFYYLEEAATEPGLGGLICTECCCYFWYSWSICFSFYPNVNSSSFFSSFLGYGACYLSCDCCLEFVTFTVGYFKFCWALSYSSSIQVFGLASTGF